MISRVVVGIFAGLLFLTVAHANRELVVPLPGGSTMEFVWIEPGVFVMGAPDSMATPDPQSRVSDYEKLQHEVLLTEGFYLGKYEITREQWGQVMDTRPWLGNDEGVDNPQYPAVSISWNDVQEFVHRLNLATGDSLYRLPTEAEWEYACRAGTASLWSYGDDPLQFDAYGWYEGNTGNTGGAIGHTVGLKRPNPWGLYDMHGNVWEWVQDWFAPYSADAVENPLGPSSGISRVLRGGYFQSSPWTASSYSRSYSTPDWRWIADGARILRIAEAATGIEPSGWGQIKGLSPVRD